MLPEPVQVPVHWPSALTHLCRGPPHWLSLVHTHAVLAVLHLFPGSEQVDAGAEIVPVVTAQFPLPDEQANFGSEQE